MPRAVGRGSPRLRVYVGGRRLTPRAPCGMPPAALETAHTSPGPNAVPPLLARPGLDLFGSVYRQVDGVFRTGRRRMALHSTRETTRPEVETLHPSWPA